MAQAVKDAREHEDAGLEERLFRTHRLEPPGSAPSCDSAALRTCATAGSWRA